MSDPEHPNGVRNDYNSISDKYDRRYEINALKGVEKTLCGLITETGARRVLEIGCGTGYWLKPFSLMLYR